MASGGTANMDILIKPLSGKDIDEAAGILSETFADDKGMRALLPEKGIKYSQKLRTWFTATLKMQLKSRQLIWGAYIKNDIKGIMVVSHTEKKTSAYALLKWTFSVLSGCGFATVKRTIRHDRNRQNYFIKKHPLILEFVATDPEHQGKGIAKRLFEQLKNHAAENKEGIWLETTKPENIKIFEKLDFVQVKEYTEWGVLYFVMRNRSNI